MMVGKPVQVCCTGKDIETGGPFVVNERNARPPDSGLAE